MSGTNTNKGNEYIVYTHKFDAGDYIMAIGKIGNKKLLDLPWNTITEDVYKEIISLEKGCVDDFAENQLERSKHEASMVI